MFVEIPNRVNEKSKPEHKPEEREERGKEENNLSDRPYLGKMSRPNSVAK